MADRVQVLSAEALASMPEHLTFEEAATLPCAGVTAWSALLGVRAGETVLTQGTGGVSLFAVQLAKAFGARVIATTSSAEKALRLLELGADEVIDYRASPDWGDQVRALTGGRGVDRVVEVGGPDTLAESAKAIAYGGQGSMGGALAAPQGGWEPLRAPKSHRQGRDPPLIGHAIRARDTEPHAGSSITGAESVIDGGT